MTIIIRSVFRDDGKFYSQIYLSMSLYGNKINSSE